MLNYINKCNFKNYTYKISKNYHANDRIEELE